MSDKTIKELIQELAGDPAAEYYGKPSEVIEVNESSRTCDVKPYDGTAIIYGVRLQAIEGSKKGVIFVPKIGSGVLVVFITKSRAFVALCEQLDKVVVDCDEVVFNGGDFGGLYKAPKTNIELTKLTTRILALEASVLAFASAQAGVSGGVPLFAPLIPAYTALSSAIAALPPQGAFNDSLIDDKIKH
jgi:hypothetical protein